MCAFLLDLAARLHLLGFSAQHLLLRMTRPAFLLLTVVACVLGTATASACGCGLDWSLALGATALAVLAHAAGNVLNDLHDARNGADAANQQGVFPFTGGSRLIQTGVVSERQTAELATALLVFLVPAGQLLAEGYGWRAGVFGFVAIALAMIPAAWLAGRVEDLGQAVHAICAERITALEANCRPD